MKTLAASFGHAGIDSSQTSKSIGKIRSYVEYVGKVIEKNGYEAPEASLLLPFDESLRATVHEVANSMRTPTLAYVFVIGIGGSNLGTMAVYEAIRGTLDAYTPQKPKLIFLDTTNAALLRDACSILERIESLDDVVINVISKSGSTTETIANFEIVYTTLVRRFGNETNTRVVVTSDAGSELSKAAAGKFMSLTLPHIVGGRYSVFSAVGLFPLALAGIDIDALHAGAREVLQSAGDSDLDKNPSLASALALYENARAGRAIANLFVFNSELQMVGQWYRQLIGESVGKEKDRDGNIVHAGIVPIVSVGSTDLHSMAQLYFGGPRTIFHMCVGALRSDADIAVQAKENRILPELVSDVSGTDVNTILDAIRSGVFATFEKEGIPYLSIEMKDLRAHSIGALLQYHMLQIMYLAELMNVNAFDQPNVESYKIETRRLLKKNT